MSQYRIILPEGQEQQLSNKEQLVSYISGEAIFFDKVFESISEKGKKEIKGYQALKRAELIVSNDLKTLKDSDFEDALHKLNEAYQDLPHKDAPMRIASSQIRLKIGGAAERGFLIQQLYPQCSKPDNIETGQLLGFLVQDGDLLNSFGKATLQVYKESNRIRQEMTDALLVTKQTTDSWTEEAKKELEGLKTEFKKIKTYETPAQYWKSRGTASIFAAVIFIAAAIACGACLGGKLYAEAANLFQGLKDQSIDSYYEFFPVVLPILLCGFGLLWLLRILLKIGFTQLHIYSDSTERVTMINTWLAMLVSNKDSDDSKVLKEKEELLLQQIFRHSPTGVIKEDTQPNVVLFKNADA